MKSREVVRARDYKRLVILEIYRLGTILRPRGPPILFGSLERERLEELLPPRLNSGDEGLSWDGYWMEVLIRASFSTFCRGNKIKQTYDFQALPAQECLHMTYHPLPDSPVVSLWRGHRYSLIP